MTEAQQVVVFAIAILLTIPATLLVVSVIDLIKWIRERRGKK